MPREPRVSSPTLRELFSLEDKLRKAPGGPALLLLLTAGLCDVWPAQKLLRRMSERSPATDKAIHEFLKGIAKMQREGLAELEEDVLLEKLSVAHDWFDALTSANVRKLQ